MGSQIPPELLIKVFIDFCSDRYPSSDKIKEMIKKIDIKSTAGKIIVLSLLRDTVRAVSADIYRSVQHRDDVYMAIIEALEDLEDQLEEEEEGERKKNEAKEK
jgi:type III secretion protein W